MKHLFTAFIGILSLVLVLFTLTVTGAGGCKRTVQWVVQPQ